VQEWVEGYETECPVQWIAEYSLVFRAYNYSEQGILPHSGGWADQPAKLMDMIAIVKRERMHQT
jgi:hypothetical protein